MKVTANEFFKTFLFSFEKRHKKNPTGLFNRFMDKTSWTNFMLDEKLPLALLPEVIEVAGQNELEPMREFLSFDLCAWEKITDPYHKPEYRQPLNFTIAIEHENEEQSEEEFWKLLHIHVPLKVLVCYPRDPKRKIDYFNRVRAKVSQFHVLSKSEEYLVIFGPQRESADDSLKIIWKGNACKTIWEGWTCTGQESTLNRLSYP